jgi:hypothetical protein
MNGMKGGPASGDWIPYLDENADKNYSQYMANNWRMGGLTPMSSDLIARTFITEAAGDYRALERAVAQLGGVAARDKADGARWKGAADIIQSSYLDPLNELGRDFQKQFALDIWWKPASMAVTPLGLIDTGIQYYNGEITSADVAVQIATLGAGKVAKAASELAGAAKQINAAERATLSPFTTRYLAESGGRWGGTATRTQNYGISQTLESRGFTVTNGGGIGPEEFIKGAGQGLRWITVTVYLILKLMPPTATPFVGSPCSWGLR